MGATPIPTAIIMMEEMFGYGKGSLAAHSLVCLKSRRSPMASEWMCEETSPLGRKEWLVLVKRKLFEAGFSLTPHSS